MTFFLPRRAEPSPDREGSCSSAQTTIRMVDCGEEVDELEVEADGGRGRTARISCCGVQ